MSLPIKRQDVIDRVDEVARACIAGRNDLYSTTSFPDAVWQSLADRNLLGLSIPVAFGGLGGDYRMIAAAAHRLSEIGGVMGVTTTWLAHNINAKLHIFDKGSEPQRREWLPRLARGETSVCVAISEPGAGAHPKYLTTTARRDGDVYVVDGEKAFLTNGPISDLFIVLAITAQVDGRKSFSAILVPRDTQGFKETPGIEIDFLRPSPHCGIELSGCRVPCANVLGNLDAGFVEISLPMRAVEDALTTAKFAGAMHAQLSELARALPQEAGKEAVTAFGQLLDKARALSASAMALAADLDEDDKDPQRLDPISAGFRGFIMDLQVDIDGFVGDHVESPTERATLMRHDLVKSLGIAATAHRIQSAKRAQSYIKGRD